MEGFAQIILYLALALAMLLFFGPIVVITSLIGKLEISKFRLDVTTLGRIGRAVLAIIGIATWLSVYIPLILFVFFHLPTPLTPTPSPYTGISTPQTSENPTPTPTIGPPLQQKFCPEPPGRVPSIRIRRVAETCGCRASDFYIIKIDNRYVRVAGGWHNRQPNTALWAFLTEERNDQVLGEPQRVIPSTPGQPDWNTYLFIPEEANVSGKVFLVVLLVLNQEATEALEKDIEDGLPITLPNLSEEHPHQKVLIERVETIEDQVSICPEET